MFAMVMTFDGEAAEETAAGVEHVQDEVIPAFAQSPGVCGWWLVDKDAGRRITVLLCDSDDQLAEAIAKVAAARAKDPDRLRPAPTTVQRYEIYGSAPATA